MDALPIIYLDTNVLTALVRERDIRSRLTNLVIELGAAVGLSVPNILELEPADRLHRQLVELLMLYPSVLLKPEEEVLSEEVAAYPDERRAPLHNLVIHDPSGDVDDHWLLELLRRPETRVGAIRHRKHSAMAPDRHDELRGNFPPAASGKYEKRQADEFANMNAFQWVAQRHTAFAKELVDKGEMEMASFRSGRMFAYLVFWRFYLNRRSPNPRSDLGDLAHAMFYPYCRAVVLENDAAANLREIKRHTDLLNGVEIMTLRDLRKYGNEA